MGLYLFSLGFSLGYTFGNVFSHNPATRIHFIASQALKYFFSIVFHPKKYK